MPRTSEIGSHNEDQLLAASEKLRFFAEDDRGRFIELTYTEWSNKSVIFDSTAIEYLRRYKRLVFQSVLDADAGWTTKKQPLRFDFIPEREHEVRIVEGFPEELYRVNGEVNKVLGLVKDLVRIRRIKTFSRWMRFLRFLVVVPLIIAIFAVFSSYASYQGYKYREAAKLDEIETALVADRNTFDLDSRVYLEATKPQVNLEIQNLDQALARLNERLQTLQGVRRVVTETTITELILREVDIRDDRTQKVTRLEEIKKTLEIRAQQLTLRDEWLLREKRALQQYSYLDWLKDKLP